MSRRFVNLHEETCKFSGPRGSDGDRGKSRVEGVLPELVIGRLVVEQIHGALHGHDEVLVVVAPEDKTVTLASLSVVLEDGVSETASAECNDRAAACESFLLDNTGWLEEGWNKSVIGGLAAEETIGEELGWVSPEVLRISVLEIPHSVGERDTVRTIVWSSLATDNELKLAVVLSVQFFEGVNDQVNTLLLDNSADEHEHALVIVDFTEVLLLDSTLGLVVVHAELLESLKSLFEADTVGVGEWMTEARGVEEIAVWRAFAKFITVALGNSGPLVSSKKSAPGWVEGVIEWINDELVWKLVDVTKSTGVAITWPELSSVSSTEVVEDVEELGAIESSTELLLAEGWDKTSHPVIADDESRDNTGLAAEFKRCLSHENKELEPEGRRTSLIRSSKE